VWVVGVAAGRLVSRPVQWRVLVVVCMCIVGEGGDRAVVGVVDSEQGGEVNDTQCIVRGRCSEVSMIA